ncbi:transglutaminase family protein [Listeria welshimeri]|nr:transglutaminase family protein [Listeria welshimeri]MBC1608041.1 transglutaminase family protein [Listeria welshimeri]MBC1613131.1 transglutaminase family protein [Listeria welshimeri]MBC1630977.1 transglutaminase family protein [Listeria welshimeri]MBC1677895.1 transglutaminase family protein [Listeria welshimeri]
MTKEYCIIQPELSSLKIKKENISSWLTIQDRDFYNAQIAQEKGYYIWYEDVETVKPNSHLSFISRVISLSNPDIINLIEKAKFVVGEDEVLYIHTLSIVRDGQVIDKINEIDIDVLNYIRDENQTKFNSDKLVVVQINDLQLNDIFIIETTVERKYEKSNIRNKYFRWMYTIPDSYWAYGKYRYELKNETEQNLSANFQYFRDEFGESLEKDKVIIEKNQSYIIEEDYYVGDNPKELEITPFIDFMTEKTYPEITKEISDIYQRFYQVDLASFAAELVAELNRYSSLNHKIKYAIDFVQKEVFNEPETNNFEPQSAEITYMTKQGDSRAKTVLLKVILDYLEIDSQLVLVNFDKDLFIPVYGPSPSTFKQAILKVTLDSQDYFIDVTMSHDEGFLANRDQKSFIYYLEIKAGTDIQNRKPLENKILCVEEIFSCDVKENIAKITLKKKLRGGIANKTRAMFENWSNENIINNYNFAIYACMFLYENFEQDKIDEYFSNTSIQIVEDNKELNELSLIYEATILKPYEIREGKRFLHYWNWNNFIDDEAEEHFHKDFPYWVDRNSIKTEIHLTTDMPIDQYERVTCQECDIKSKYVNYCVTKKIKEYGASCYIESIPYYNLAITGKDLEEYINVNKQIQDNNWGISIDILE